ncbi:alpha/beta-hydrolase [Cylindrobasidium torrendii FP15055 ss-10]|uniref:Alpha/beta-hydrolase n=1 Tax=Cylindrobasidium torrendii FP15055 ss-10 TaxID=1314674 RepID=A0A0D7B976_9AGAR|nr:alpha/beta-hydrolase [Cylindrobasidium torrendii FP15055 ss-10]
MARTAVKIPSVTPGWNLDAWQFFPPAAPSTGALPPVVILSPGFACIKEMGLEPYAKAFAERGYASIVFDYRRWGDSDGTPRYVADFREQREDYRTVVRWARAQGVYDNDRVVLWGYSYSSGHTVVLAGEEEINAVAAIAFRSYTGVMPNYSIVNLLVMLGNAIVDSARQALGLSPYYVPVTGENRLVLGEDATRGYNQAGAHVGWVNKMTASSLFINMKNRPIDLAQNIRCPTLLVAAKDDELCVFPGLLRMAAKSPKFEFEAVPGGHFDGNPGCKDYEQQLGMMLKFLEKHVPI